VNWLSNGLAFTGEIVGLSIEGDLAYFCLESLGKGGYLSF